MTNSSQERNSPVADQVLADQGNIVRHLLHVLFKRKLTVVAFLVPVVAIALVYYFFIYQASYTPSARLLLEMGREHVSDLSFATGGEIRPVIRFDPEQQTTIATEVIRGPQLLQEVVSEIGYHNIYPDLEERSLGIVDRLRSFLGFPPDRSMVNWEEVAALQIAENLYLTPLGTSGLLVLAFTHRDAVMASTVVNKIVEAFISRHLALSRDPQLIRFFESEFENLQADLNRSEAELQGFKRDHGISGEIDGERDLILNQSLKIRNELRDAEDNIAKTKARNTLLQQQLANTSRNPEGLAELKSRLLQLELKEGEVLLNYEEQSRVVQNVRAEIASVKRKIADLGGSKLYGNAPVSDGSLYEQLQAALLAGQVELEEAKVIRSGLEARVAELRSRLSELDEAELQLRTLSDLASNARERYKLYHDKYQESLLGQSMDGRRLASVKIVEYARAPLSPDPDRRKLILALALFVGVVGGFAMALLQELLSGTLETPEDSEAHLGLPVLASIPEARLLQA